MQAQRQKVVDLKVDPEKQKAFSLEEELQVTDSVESRNGHLVNHGSSCPRPLSTHLNDLNVLQKLRDSVDLNSYENKPVPRTENETQ